MSPSPSTILIPRLIAGAALAMPVLGMACGARVVAAEDNEAFYSGLEADFDTLPQCRFGSLRYGSCHGIVGCTLKNDTRQQRVTEMVEARLDAADPLLRACAAYIGVSIGMTSQRLRQVLGAPGDTLPGASLTAHSYLVLARTLASGTIAPLDLEIAHRAMDQGDESQLGTSDAIELRTLGGRAIILGHGPLERVVDMLIEQRPSFEWKFLQNDLKERASEEAVAGRLLEVLESEDAQRSRWEALVPVIYVAAHSGRLEITARIWDYYRRMSAARPQDMLEKQEREDQCPFDEDRRTEYAEALWPVMAILGENWERYGVLIDRLREDKIRVRATYPIPRGASGREFQLERVGDIWVVEMQRETEIDACPLRR